MAISSEIDYIKKSKKYIQWLDNIKSQINNIDNLLNTLTIITKIENKNKLDSKIENISDITNETIDIISKFYKHKNINIEKNIWKNIKKQINKEEYSIIIKNILENAFKFTPDKWTITISLDNKKLEIKDNWMWISKKDINLIRERFWQADLSKTDTKSFWLWLYLTKLLTQRHWRQIDVKSEIKKWTTFKIYFQ